jgi:hypothetical protein
MYLGMYIYIYGVHEGMHVRIYIIYIYQSYLVNYLFNYFKLLRTNKLIIIWFVGASDLAHLRSSKKSSHSQGPREHCAVARNSIGLHPAVYERYLATQISWKAKKRVRKLSTVL